MKNTRFLMKISLLLLTPAFICVVVAVLIAVHGLRQKTESDLLGASRSAITQLEAARDYVARMNVFSRQAAELAQKYPDGKIPLEEKKQLMLSVPIVSALELKGVGEKEGGYEARVISDNARRPVNAPKTDEENRILKSFRADAALKELNFEENGFIYVARPIRLHESQGCLACHGAPARSPWGNGKDIVGFQMEDMKDGDLKGAFVIKTSLAPVRAESWRIFATVAGWSLLVCVLIIAGSIFVLRGTLNRLVGTIQKLRETGESLTSKAGEVSGTSEALQQGTERSAQAIEQAQVAMEQIVSMARSNGDNAQAASTSARETRGQTQSVVDETREVVGAIHQIQESMLALSRDVEKGNADLGQVVSVIRGIGDKVKVINEIVFQTKLLSFNASVEAARAGEHGKGFAVVAEEIGNLAVMSGNSAQEIEKLLADSVRQVEGMVEDMRRRVVASVAQGRTTVDAGVNLANRSLESLNRIASIAGEMERSVESITTAGQEQVKGAEQVKLGVSDLSEVVSETFKSSNQLRGQSGDLAGLSDQLRVLAGDLESLIDSRAGKDAA